MRFFLAIICLYSNISFSQSVSISSDEWFPMNGTPGSDPAGFLIDLAERTFASVDYKMMPWARALSEVRRGNIDCVAGAYKDDVPDFVFPEENWGFDQNALFITDDDTWVYSGVESLTSRKIGVIKGYSYEDEIESLMKRRKDIFKIVSGLDGLEKNFKKLASGRIDTLLESYTVATAKIKKLGLEGKFKAVGYTNEPTAIYIACSPANSRSAELVQKIDEVTKLLRANGELEAIMNKYGLSDWK